MGVYTPCLIVYKTIPIGMAKDSSFSMYFKVLKIIKLERGEPHECEGNF